MDVPGLSLSGRLQSTGDRAHEFDIAMAWIPDAYHLGETLVRLKEGWLNEERAIWKGSRYGPCSWNSSSVIGATKSGLLT